MVPLTAVGDSWLRPAMLATLGVAATLGATLLIWRRHETTMMALKWLFYVILCYFNMF